MPFERTCYAGYISLVYLLIEKLQIMLLNHLLLLVASIGAFGYVAGQNEIPTVPCYGPDCLVTEPTTEMATSPTTESTTTTELPTSPTTVPTTTTSRPADIRRTVIVVIKQTIDGQDLFIRGGIDGTTVRPSCTGDTNAETTECAISINTTALGTGTHWAKYDAWRVGDTKLDWIGAQVEQGTYGTVTAFGTPLAWTTNDITHPGYQQLNKWGPNSWMVDLDMNCDETIEGWFDLKAFLAGGSGWEPNIAQLTCMGTAFGAGPPYSGTPNHVARCGYINKFDFGASTCEINPF